MTAKEEIALKVKVKTLEHRLREGTKKLKDIEKLITKINKNIDVFNKDIDEVVYSLQNHVHKEVSDDVKEITTTSSIGFKLQNLNNLTNE